jgi:predicted nucleic acid-binding protein
MIALDTNILIYACDKSDARRQQIALDLIADAVDGILLWQVACEFVAASRKLSAQGFTAAHAGAAFPNSLVCSDSPFQRPASLSARELCT